MRTLYGSEWSFKRYELNHFQPQNTYGPRGGFTFTGGLTSLKEAQRRTRTTHMRIFLLGLPQAMGKDTQFLNPGTLRESVWAFMHETSGRSVTPSR